MRTVIWSILTQVSFPLWHAYTTDQSSQDHWNHLGLTLPHSAYLRPQVTVLCQILSMLPANIAIGRTAGINKKTRVSLLVSETDVRYDLPCSGDGCIPHHYDVAHLCKPIRLMPVPPALCWNLKMPINVPVDDEGDLVVSASVVCQCHNTIACHNMVDCLQACIALVATATDTLMQDVVLIAQSPKSLVLSSHHQSLSCTKKVCSLLPAKGLFHMHRQWLSETTILTVHRFPAPGPHMMRIAAHLEMFCNHLRHLFKTSSEAMVLLLCRFCDRSSSARFLCNCSVKQQAMRLLDRVPVGPSRVTFIYHLHVWIGTIMGITVQPHNARFFAPSQNVAGPQPPALQGAHLLKDGGHLCMVRSFTPSGCLPTCRRVPGGSCFCVLHITIND